MITKGKIADGDPVNWNVKVDPTIEGGVVYNLGDVLVDCSVKTLKDEFYESLSSAGIKRVE
jgi:F0F1-type ATP synthase delta subunit